MKLSDTIGKPISEEEVRVRFRDSKGRVTDGKIAIGETVTQFEQLLNDKQSTLQGLWQEWDQVRQDIAELGAELLDDPSFPTEFGLQARGVTTNSNDVRSSSDQHIAALRDEIRAACDKSREDIGKEAEEDTRARKAKRNQWLDMLKRDSF